MNPTNNKPLETELVAASFNQAYKTVMALGERVESRQEGIEASLASVVSDIGDMTALTTEATDSLVAAINEVDAHADTNAQAISDEVTRATGKEDKLAGDISVVETLANNNKTAIGTLSNLDTTAKSNLVEAINEVDTEVATKADDDAVVHLTGDETVAGKKTFSTLPCLPSLTTETPTSTSNLVGYDAEGNLIPAIGGGGSSLPSNADYVKTSAQGEPQKGVADTTVTEDSTALVQSGAVFTAVKGEADRAKEVEGILTNLTTTAKSNLVAAINELDSGKSDLTNLAPAFDSTIAYAVGDYVTYDGLLYKCTSVHSAGAWDDSDFTALAVSTELISQLDQIKVLQKLYDYIVYDQTTLDYIVEHQDSFQGKTVALCAGTYSLEIDGTRYTDNTAGTSRTFRAIQGVNFVGFGKPVVNITNVGLNIPDGFTGANVYALSGSYSGVIVNYTVDFSGTVPSFRAFSMVSGCVIKDCEITMNVKGLSLGALSLTVAGIGGTTGVILNTNVSIEYTCADTLTSASVELASYSIGRDSIVEGCTTTSLSVLNKGGTHVTGYDFYYSGSSALRYGRIRDCRAAGTDSGTASGYFESFYGFRGCLNMLGCRVSNDPSSAGATYGKYDTDTTGTTYCCSTSTRQATYVVADTPEGGFNS